MAIVLVQVPEMRRYFKIRSW
ncbi:MAG: hypothetical protein ACR2ML_10530 [Solirubrobacteraceae bacterium]